MDSIVHEDQTCGVVGRTIFSNLHLVRDALDMIARMTDEPAILGSPSIVSIMIFSLTSFLNSVLAQISADGCASFILMSFLV